MDVANEKGQGRSLLLYHFHAKVKLFPAVFILYKKLSLSLFVIIDIGPNRLTPAFGHLKAPDRTANHRINILDVSLVSCLNLILLTKTDVT